MRLLTSNSDGWVALVLSDHCGLDRQQGVRLPEFILGRQGKTSPSEVPLVVRFDLGLGFRVPDAGQVQSFLTFQPLEHGLVGACLVLCRIPHGMPSPGWGACIPSLLRDVEGRKPCAP